MVSEKKLYRNTLIPDDPGKNCCLTPHTRHRYPCHFLCPACCLRVVSLFHLWFLRLRDRNVFHSNPSLLIAAFHRHLIKKVIFSKSNSLHTNTHWFGQTIVTCINFRKTKTFFFSNERRVYSMTLAFCQYWTIHKILFFKFWELSAIWRYLRQPETGAQFY